MQNSFSIFINTTDSFEDCWIPFFTLFKKYWPAFSGKIYLNTEKKSFQLEGLNIISVQNENKVNGKPNWGKSLVTALNFIEEDIILYMQEDYFLNNYVNTQFIEKAYQLMLSNNSIGCIHLTDQATSGPFEEFEESPDFKLISLFADYRISCQAALWRKNILLKYIRTYESPWQFELIGTKRAKFIYQDTFLSITHELFGIGKKEIIPYVFTGIVKGRWKSDVVSLFNENKIYVDFSKRGFIENSYVSHFLLKKKTKDFFFRLISSAEISIKKSTKIR